MAEKRLGQPILGRIHARTARLRTPDEYRPIPSPIILHNKTQGAGGGSLHRCGGCRHCLGSRRRDAVQRRPWIVNVPFDVVDSPDPSTEYAVGHATDVQAELADLCTCGCVCIQFVAMPLYLQDVHSASMLLG